MIHWERHIPTSIWIFPVTGTVSAYNSHSLHQGFPSDSDGQSQLPCTDDITLTGCIKGCRQSQRHRLYRTRARVALRYPPRTLLAYVATWACLCGFV
ncbi:hypothetical protein KIPB_009882 [Kipferlia bialata]|uniref:Uncharacterized protein n=1 Tax=Kipferlia bialata TaxID=797122 RepID=A0A9K3GMF4_9EUKA|nr:hypothetical protein KIPB_009882 [Kipferlia bialata]|eukprot:g9882.t1